MFSDSSTAAGPEELAWPIPLKVFTWIAGNKSVFSIGSSNYNGECSYSLEQKQLLCTACLFR